MGDKVNQLAQGDNASVVGGRRSLKEKFSKCLILIVLLLEVFLVRAIEIQNFSTLSPATGAYTLSTKMLQFSVGDYLASRRILNCRLALYSPHQLVSVSYLEAVQDCNQIFFFCCICLQIRVNFFECADFALSHDSSPDRFSKIFLIVFEIYSANI